MSVVRVRKEGEGKSSIASHVQSSLKQAGNWTRTGFQVMDLYNVKQQFTLGNYTVKRVIQMVNRNEYKRRQAAIGVRITERAFGKDWRYPITSGFTALS